MPNLDKPNAQKCTQRVISKLIEYNIMPTIDNRYRHFFEGDEDFPNTEVEFLDFYTAIYSTDVVIAIGGDGTIIHSAKHAVAYDKPLLGINVGRLGFMAGLEMSELHLLKHLVEQDYTIENRMMLRCLHYTEEAVNEYLALNDVVISNGALSRIIDLEVLCNDNPVASYRADGVIFATPTGSTAYALSAGGPIVEPALNSISMTPICPHSLVERTVIFSDDKVLMARSCVYNRHPIYITIDGEQGAKLEKNDFLEIMRSPQTVKLINLNKKQFYEVLDQKFKLHNNEPVNGNYLI